MYGPADSDPVVRYYDQTLGRSDSDARWYVAKAQRFGGPVLDLGCGTGRIAIALARAGLDVTAMDRSEGMLARLRAKLAAETEGVQQRITVVHGPMSSPQLPQRFRTIICCDAFFHNLTIEEQMGCLEAVAAHLEPEGRLLFNLPNPTCAFLLKASEADEGAYRMRGEYPREDAPGAIVVETWARADLVEQLITTRLLFTVRDAGGRVAERSESSWQTRYLWPYEAVHLLARCGLEVEALWGGYDERPLSAEGHLVFQAKRAA